MESSPRRRSVEIEDITDQEDEYEDIYMPYDDIYMPERVQDHLRARDPKKLQCLNTIGTLQVLIKVKEQRAEIMRRAILHPLLEYFIRT